MSVLSDADIEASIAVGQLVEHGNSDHVDACAYEFHAGRIFRTGELVGIDDVTDWTGSTSYSDIYEIQSGELVWIRTRESVVMPEDVCAFWWQTNRLSRQGLMLVNMSMVEPGYEGDLSCLFVNFGRKAITINPETVIAKLVFHRLETVAATPFSQSVSQTEYDRKVLLNARDAPPTFLDVGGRLEVDLRQKKDEAVAAIEAMKQSTAADIESQVGTATTAALAQIEATKTSAERDLKASADKDARGLLWRILGVASIGLAVLILAMTFVPWVQSKLQPNLSSEIKKQVDESLTERIVGSGEAGTASELEDRIRDLEARLSQLSAPGQGTP
jgi:deoxycytidine triphosphate deaminase